MTDLKKTITKGTLGTVAAGAMALASATPAMVDNGRDRGGVDAGDIIAGAVIIGGIAAQETPLLREGGGDRLGNHRRYCSCS